VTTAFNTLRSAGVTAFVSSGNDADKSELGFPSCISSAVSVGDVYDANVGGITWSSCTDSSTWADLVVCHSNSHSTLDLLAPGALIVSSVNGGGTDEYGGTSMAAPHATGVAALMLDADPPATPDEIESCMKNTGVSVTDPANSVTTPRVDALGAVGCISLAPCVFANDADCDACWDSVEPTLTPPADPAGQWDFYDVPVPTLYSGGHISGDPSGTDDRDHAISIINDVLAVLEYGGTSDGGPPNAEGRHYTQDMNGDTVSDGMAYDRLVGGTRSAGPDGAVSIIVDVLLVLEQGGYGCGPTPP